MEESWASTSGVELPQITSGVTPQTLRKYTRQGVIPHLQNHGGQYLYTIKDLNDYLGVPEPEPDNIPTRIAFYTRSSSGQDATHKSQLEILQSKYGNPVLTVKDNASGLKDNRKGLQTLINKAKEGQYNVLAITHKDRLTRFGFHYLEELFTQLGVTIVIADEDDKKTIHEELLQDFMSLIASFSGRYYRLRGYEQQKLLLHKAESEIQNKESNMEEGEPPCPTPPQEPSDSTNP